MSVYFRRFDWWLFAAIIPLAVFGLLTMKRLGPSGGEADYFFWRQLFWFAIGLAAFVGAARFDVKLFEKRTLPLLLLWGASVFLSALLFFAGPVRGVKSWFTIGAFSFEPVEPVKLALILMLAKYFSRRHIEIKRWRHIFISALYAAIPLALVIRQPDFGSAFILLAIWAGITFFSGVSMRQVAWLSAGAVFLFAMFWFFLFAPYQKERIVNFFDPLRDPAGAGYQTLQSKIAIGSGGLFGKGLGHGTQSRLYFLPEPQTDFIFAAFAEEWGLFGVSFLFASLGIFFWRLIRAGMRARANFERLFILGVLLFFFTQGAIHIGMNLGVFPITGIGLPFMSYGGSLLVTSFIALGLAESIIVRRT